MYYPESFKVKCKELYPTWDSLHRLLEQGNSFAGRYLDDARYSGVSLDEILNATSLDDLKQKARLGRAKEQLYAEWCDLYEKGE